jgi:hypothetical protein
LVQLEESGDNLTPEEHEAAARLSNAGEYWMEWVPFCVAQQLFSEEVDKVDSGSWDKTNKMTFGKCTTAIREWYAKLPQRKWDKAEKVTKK